VTAGDEVGRLFPDAPIFVEKVDLPPCVIFMFVSSLSLAWLQEFGLVFLSGAHLALALMSDPTLSIVAGTGLTPSFLAFTGHISWRHQVYICSIMSNIKSGQWADLFQSEPNNTGPSLMLGRGAKVLNLPLSGHVCCISSVPRIRVSKACCPLKIEGFWYVGFDSVDVCVCCCMVPCSVLF
jgi:hypothetical protein